MILTRRHFIGGSGGFLAALVVGLPTAKAAQVIEISMQGKPDGSHVWFDPIGIHVKAGQTIRWTNRDAGNSHTVTAYHPSIFDRPLRIPAKAAPFDSDYLLPGESFSQTFVEEGVYDYYCVPHEHAGMVGRIVVGTPTVNVDTGVLDPALTPLPDVALARFPSVDEILAKGIVR